MDLHRRTQRRITLLTLYSLALSLSVALWGAEYKMEQYPQQGLAFRVMPPAKLLTEKERPVRKRSLQAVLARIAHNRAAGASSACAAPAPSRRVYSASFPGQLPAVPNKAAASPQFTYFSSRPPPALSLS